MLEQDKKEVMDLLQEASDKLNREYSEEAIQENVISFVAEAISEVYCHILGVHTLKSENLRVKMEILTKYCEVGKKTFSICSICGVIAIGQTLKPVEFEGKTLSVCTECGEIPTCDISGKPLIFIDDGEVRHLSYRKRTLIQNGRSKLLRISIKNTGVEMMQEKYKVTTRIYCKNCGNGIFYDRNNPPSLEDVKCEVCKEPITGEFVLKGFDGTCTEYNILPFNRTFGIELESSGDIVANSLLVETPFKAVDDGSIQGKEWVSEILKGDEGVRSIEHFLSSILGKAPIASEAGFHLHLGLKSGEVNIHNVKKILAIYSTFEDAMFAMLPPSRRGNRYCKDISLMLEESNNTIKSVSRLLKLKGSLQNFIDEMYGNSSGTASRYNELRYGWVNIHSIFYRGTLEIRNHSATFNYKKIFSWILLHQTILDFALNSSLTDIVKLYENTGRGVSPQLKALYRIFPNTKQYKELKQYINKRVKKFGINEGFEEVEEYETDREGI